MADISISVTGFPALQKRLQSLIERTPATVANALYEESNVIMTDAKTNYVPFDTGTLANSGKVELPTMDPKGVSVSFGFGGNAAPYAISVHENPRAGKTGGVSPGGFKYLHWARRGQWKYLETPLKAHAPEVGLALQQALKRLQDDRGTA